MHTAVEDTASHDESWLAVAARGLYAAHCTSAFAVPPVLRAAKKEKEDAQIQKPAGSSDARPNQPADPSSDHPSDADAEPGPSAAAQPVSAADIAPRSLTPGTNEKAKEVHSVISRCTLCSKHIQFGY